MVSCCANTESVGLYDLIAENVYRKESGENLNFIVQVLSFKETEKKIPLARWFLSSLSVQVKKKKKKAWPLCLKVLIKEAWPLCLSVSVKEVWFLFVSAILR